MRKERLYWNCWLRRDLFHGFARDVRKLLCISLYRVCLRRIGSRNAFLSSGSIEVARKCSLCVQPCSCGIKGTSRCASACTSGLIVCVQKDVEEEGACLCAHHG